MKENTLSHYEKFAPEISARYEKIDFSRVQNELLKVLPGKTSVLEGGCGSGRDSAFLLSRGIDVTALDGSWAMLADAKRLHPELDGRLLHHRLPEPLPFSDEVFDAVYSIAVLMHLQKSEVAGVIIGANREELPNPWRIERGGFTVLETAVVAPAASQKCRRSSVREHPRDRARRAVSSWAVPFAWPSRGGCKTRRARV